MVSVTAKGASGALYTFEAIDGPITWNDVPAIYMLVPRKVGAWAVHYIGQCDSAKTRMPTHERWEEAVRDYGATHIITHLAPRDEAVRKTEEQDLILSHDPPMNVHHRPSNALRGLLG